MSLSILVDFSLPVPNSQPVVAWSKLRGGQTAVSHAFATSSCPHPIRVERGVPLLI